MKYDGKEEYHMTIKELRMDRALTRGAFAKSLAEDYEVTVFYYNPIEHHKDLKALQ